MPLCHSISLDLGAWSRVLPQERANDPDYNLLLHKFRQFYNEVKEFQELHSNCSVTREALASITHQNNNRDNNNLPTNLLKNSNIQLNNNEFSNWLGKTDNIKMKPLLLPATTRLEPKHRAGVRPVVASSSPAAISPAASPVISGINLCNNSKINSYQVPKNDQNDQDEVSSLNILKSPPSAFKNSLVSVPPSVKRMDNSQNVQQRMSSFYTDDDDIYDSVAPDDITSPESPNETMTDLTQVNRSNSSSFKNNDNKNYSPMSSFISTSRDKNIIKNLHQPSSDNQKLKKNQKLSGKQSTSSLASEPRNDNLHSNLNSIDEQLKSNYTLSASLSSLSNPTFDSTNIDSIEEDAQFADYVNIDYFLKRANTPPGNDERREYSMEDSRQITQSEHGINHSDERLDSHGAAANFNTLVDVQPSAPTLSRFLTNETIQNSSTNSLLRPSLKTDHHVSQSTLDASQSFDEDGCESGSGSYHRQNLFSSFSDATNSSTHASNDNLVAETSKKRTPPQPKVRQHHNSNDFDSHFSPSKYQTKNHAHSFDNGHQDGGHSHFQGHGRTNFKGYNANSQSDHHDLSEDQGQSKDHYSDSPSDPDLHSFGIRNPSPRGQSQKKSAQNDEDIAEKKIENENEDDLKQSIVGVHKMMSSFLSDLNLSDSLFQGQEKIQRRIVKESFAVELSSGKRKLRHLFLFNDIIVCAKYQASSKQKFTFDVKWYLSLSDISIPDCDQQSILQQTERALKRNNSVDTTFGQPSSGSSGSQNALNTSNQILAIKTSLSVLRTQFERMSREKKLKPTSRQYKRMKKKRTELEADLVLLLPHLPLTILYQGQNDSSSKRFTFYLSSNFERNQWIDSIRVLQHQLLLTNSNSVPNSGSRRGANDCSAPVTTPSPNELQAWIQTCRKSLNPNLGSFLLRSNSDEDLLYGDLTISLCHFETDFNLSASPNSNDTESFYFCFEVDNYGHFFQKATSSMISSESCDLDEDFIIALDGTHTLRVLFYEHDRQQNNNTQNNLVANVRPKILGKSVLELSRTWLSETPVQKVISFGSNGANLVLKLSYQCSEWNLSLFPHTRIYAQFGTDIEQVCKKEKSSVPLLIQLCVREVERRGMKEVGIYRMSGLSSDILRLRKAFETNTHAAELLLRELDIHAVTGLLKMYLRELPDALFTNSLYMKFVSAFNMPQLSNAERTSKMMALFTLIPPVNQMTITMLIEHLVKVNQFESHNKMSLTNLATVFGLNMIRSDTSSGSGNSSTNSSNNSDDSKSTSTSNDDPFTAGTITVMAQAGILYLFLCRVSSGLSLVPTDKSMTESPSH